MLVARIVRLRRDKNVLLARGVGGHPLKVVGALRLRIGRIQGDVQGLDLPCGERDGPGQGEGVDFVIHREGKRRASRGGERLDSQIEDSVLVLFQHGAARHFQGSLVGRRNRREDRAVTGHVHLEGADDGLGGLETDVGDGDVGLARVGHVHGDDRHERGDRKGGDRIGGDSLDLSGEREGVTGQVGHVVRAGLDLRLAGSGSDRHGDGRGRGGGRAVRIHHEPVVRTGSQGGHGARRMARFRVIHGESAVGHVGLGPGLRMEKGEAVAIHPKGGQAFIGGTGVLRRGVHLEGRARGSHLNFLDRSTLRQGKQPGRKSGYFGKFHFHAHNLQIYAKK